MSRDPCQQLNEWIQKYPGTLQVCRQEGECSPSDGKGPTLWYCSMTVTYVPPEHNCQVGFRVHGTAHSKKDIRKLVAERILQLFSPSSSCSSSLTQGKSQPLVLYKHGALPCERCHALPPAPYQVICVAQDFDNGLQRLNSHCQKQGLALCVVSETPQKLTVSHPLLPSSSLEFPLSEGSRLESKSLAINGVIQTLNQELIDTYLAKTGRMHKQEIGQLLAKTTVTHVALRGPEDIKCVEVWLQDGKQGVDGVEGTQGPLVFDTEWDRKTPVILAFCKSGSSVLLARLCSDIDYDKVAALLKSVLQQRSLVCLDKRMEVCALQKLGCDEPALFRDAMVDLACVISQLYPAFSSKAGLLRYSRWFLQWDISPYQLDFKALQKKGVSWHDVAKNESLRNHVTVDCLAVWELMATIGELQPGMCVFK